MSREGVSTMDYVPGSLKFFKSFSVSGLKPRGVNATLGHVHITLDADMDMDVEVLRSQYINAITPLLPVGQSITVSIEESILG